MRRIIRNYWDFPFSKSARVLIPTLLVSGSKFLGQTSPQARENAHFLVMSPGTQPNIIRRKMALLGGLFVRLAGTVSLSTLFRV